MTISEDLIKILLMEIQRFNKNTEEADEKLPISLEILSSLSVFDTRDFIPKFRQSSTPTEFICGKQGQLGIIEYNEDGSKKSEIFLNKYEVSVLKTLLKYKF